MLRDFTIKSAPSTEAIRAFEPTFHITQFDDEGNPRFQGVFAADEVDYIDEFKTWLCRNQLEENFDRPIEVTGIGRVDGEECILIPISEFLVQVHIVFRK